jgi:hypothetical protein
MNDSPITIPVDRTPEIADKGRLQTCYRTLFKTYTTCILGWRRTFQLMKAELDL